MRKSLYLGILRLFGWKIHYTIPKEIKKGIVIVAPHTSNWDFVIGKLAFIKISKHAKFLIKQEWFKFPMGPFLKWVGALPVDRSSKSMTTKQIANHFKNAEELFIIITPEGTRKRTNHWKKGFYQIAMHTNLPICFAFVDYKKKEGGLTGYFYPTGDYDKDFEIIKEFYKDVTAKYPENFNLEK